MCVKQNIEHSTIYRTHQTHCNSHPERMHYQTKGKVFLIDVGKIQQNWFDLTPQ